MKNCNFSYQYLAGFLDADGSVYVSVKHNTTFRFNYQIAPFIVIFQKNTNKIVLEEIQRFLGYGKVRTKNDGMSELVISTRKDLINFINQVLPYTYLKKQNLVLLMDLINMQIRSSSIKTLDDFEEMLRISDQISNQNYSKTRINNFSKVSSEINYSPLETC